MDDREINIQPLVPDGGTRRGGQAGREEKKGQEQKMKKACADFESIFIYQMLKTMRSTVPRSSLLNKMTGKETYETIMDQKMSEELTVKGGLGIQEMLFRQLNREK